MRSLIHILRAGCYLTLLPYLAYAKRESFATCMKDPGAVFTGVVLAGVTFLIIVGYGTILAMKNSKATNATFWISSIGFYTACASLAIIRSHDGLFTRLTARITLFHDVFIPQFQQYLALDAVGELTFVALTIWMPVASLLSMIAFATALSKRRLGVTVPA